MRDRYRCIFIIALLFLNICFMANTARADCLACFELRGVRIEMKNGTTHRGYVEWNSVWFKERETAIFPDALLSSEGWQYSPLKAVRVYTKVYKVKHPLPVLVTTRTDSTTLPTSDIQKMLTSPQEYDGYQDAVGLPSLSLRAIQMLSEAEPSAVWQDDSGVMDIYLVSFNREIGKDKLRRIYDVLSKDHSPQKVEELEDLQIIYLSLPYD